jgi:hypothetical protein
MGVFGELDIVFRNYFPDEKDYDKLLNKFYKWLNNEDENMIFVSGKQGYFYDLCNNEKASLITAVEYWCKHIKLGIHDGEGFVIKQ